MKTIIRYFQHSIFPEYSGVALYHDDVWQLQSGSYDREIVQKLQMDYPDALVEEAALPEGLKK